MRPWSRKASDCAASYVNGVERSDGRWAAEPPQPAATTTAARRRALRLVGRNATRPQRRVDAGADPLVERGRASRQVVDVAVLGGQLLVELALDRPEDPLLDALRELADPPLEVSLEVALRPLRARCLRRRLLRRRRRRDAHALDLELVD